MFSKAIPTWASKPDFLAFEMVPDVSNSVVETLALKFGRILCQNGQAFQVEAEVPCSVKSRFLDVLFCFGFSKGSRKFLNLPALHHSYMKMAAESLAMNRNNFNRYTSANQISFQF